MGGCGWDVRYLEDDVALGAGEAAVEDPGGHLEVILGEGTGLDFCWGCGGWVGGWVGNDMLPFWKEMRSVVGCSQMNRLVGGWVGGWVGHILP